MAPALTILEGKWFKDSDVSVRDLFFPLFAVWTKNPGTTYHYEQFTNGQAFRDGVAYAFQNGRARTIYIGAHGDQNRIYGFHDQGISRAVIRNCLHPGETGTKRGIYFGACNFATQLNAEFILRSCPRVEWIAGYASDVNWTESSALDLYFFRHFLFPMPGKGTPQPRTQIEHLDYAVRQVTRDMASLTRRLQLRVYVRRRGNSKGIKEIVADNLDAE